MPAVESSAILRIAYDELAEELRITFISGKRYIYAGVPPAVYAAFLAADSKGTFFNEHIRDHYSFALESEPAVSRRVR